jgi:hypothetical protein
MALPAHRLRALGWDYDRMRPKTWQGVVRRASLKNRRLGLESDLPCARGSARGQSRRIKQVADTSARPRSRRSGG